MAELGARAAQVLARTMERSNARTVTVSSGAQEAELLGTRGQSEWDLIDAGGMPVKVVSVDWIFRASSWLDAFGADPDAGWRITEVDGDQERVYEVMAPDGKQPFRQDSHRSVYRIFTKQIETQAA